MQLDRIQAVVRPRNAWESIDLGFSMVRQWWKSLYKLWFIFVLPIFLLVYLLFYDNWWLPILIIWWLKPGFDRIILYFLSLALFDEQPGIQQTWQALPRFFKTHLLLALTWWRFDFARSFNLAVWQLEGLKGKKAYQRMKILQRDTQNVAIQLTVVCLLFYVMLYLSLFVLVYLMMPTVHIFNFFYIIFENEWLLKIMSMVFNLFALSVVEPLYVAGGFALYLNRRTHLEGWDIELAFRRIASHY